MAVKKLSSIQKERVTRLESSLRLAVQLCDLKTIKDCISDLQSIYLSTGNDAKLLMAKNRWLEVEMEQGNLSTAERGLAAVRIKANKNTRIYLEATTLLAICFLRNSQLEKAEPLMREVLTIDGVIKSSQKRMTFRKAAIARFDEEAVLYAIKLEGIYEMLSDIAALEAEASDLAEEKTSDQLFENLGQRVPKIAKDVLFRVDSFSKKQLPSAERLKLPSPTQAVEDKEVGKTVFSSIKRVIYKSLCDKDGDLNNKVKAGIVSIQTTLTVIVADLFSKLNMAIRVVIVNVIAIVLKLGLDLYCEQFKPADLMGLR